MLATRSLKSILGRCGGKPTFIPKATRRWFPTLQQHAKIAQRRIPEPIGLQGGMPQARPNDVGSVLKPRKGPSRHGDTPKSHPGRPRNFTERLKVQKTPLQKPILAKIDIEHNFDHFLIEV